MIPRICGDTASLVVATMVVVAATALAQDADWMPSNGPWGGQIVALAVAPDTGVLYAAKSQYLAMSSDGGQTWTQVPGSAGIANILSLAAGPGGRLMVGVSTRGVWWSQNGGTSWDQDQITHDPHGGLGASVIAVAVTPALNMFAMHWRSVNGGANWLEMSITAMAFVFLSDGTAVAGTYDSVAISTNEGASWQPAAAGIDSLRIEHLAVTPDDVIFAGSSVAGLYRSPDRGVTWTPVHGGIGTTAISAVACDAAGRVYAGTVDGGIFLSLDGGDTWAPVAGALPDPRVRCLAMAPGDRVLAGFVASGVAASDDQGANWSDVNAGLPVFWPRAAVSTAADATLLGTASAGVFRSDDGAATWGQTIAGLAVLSVTDLARSPDGTIVAGGYGGVDLSHDGGATWAPTELTGTYLHVGGVAADPAGRIFAWVESSPTLVYRSVDGGFTWQPAYVVADLPIGGFFDDLATAPDGRLYLGGFSFFVEGLLLTSGDGGDTWDVRDVPAVSELAYLATQSDGTLVAASDQGDLLQTTDTGVSWTPLAAGPWASNVTALVCAPDDAILVGTGTEGVFRSADDGQTWQPYRTGLPNTDSLYPQITMLGVADGALLAGTLPGGLYHTAYETATAAPDAPAVPAPIALAQNRPNPFNPRTTITFSLAQAGPAHIALFDVRGRRVRVLVDGPIAAGRHNVEWDGRDDQGHAMPSGVYLCRLQAANHEARTRMLLAR